PGLEAAEAVHPATRDVLGGLRRLLALVVHYGELRDPAVLGLDLPRDAAVLLGSRLCVVKREPCVNEPVGRLRLLHDAVDPDLLAVRGQPAIRGAGLERRLDATAVEVAAREVRIRDR